MYFQRLWPHVSDNLTVILAGLATLIISLRVLYIARFDLTVALSIVQAGGTETVLGIILQSLPVVIGFIAGTYAALLFLPPIGVHNHWDALVIGVSIVVAIFVAPLYVLIILAVLTIIAVWLVRGESDDDSPTDTPAPAGAEPPDDEVNLEMPPWVTGIGTVLATLAVGQLLVATEMWLPAERMVVQGRPVVGYDIRSESGWTTILVHGDASVRRVPTRLITTRTICNVEEAWLWDRPVHALFDPDVTPLC